MVRNDVVSEEDIPRWIFEDSVLEGEFSDESENEETLPVCSNISSSETGSNDEEEDDDNTQPVTRSWKVVRCTIVSPIFRWPTRLSLLSCFLNLRRCRYVPRFSYGRPTLRDDSGTNRCYLHYIF